MALSLSVAARNARLDAVQTVIGASPQLLFFSGSPAASCAAPDPTGLLLTIGLPAVWLTPAAGGMKTMLGIWTAVSGAAGTISCFRIKDQLGTTTHLQGLAGATGDMIVSSPNLVFGQTLTVLQFTLTDQNL